MRDRRFEKRNKIKKADDLFKRTNAGEEGSAIRPEICRDELREHS